MTRALSRAFTMLCLLATGLLPHTARAEAPSTKAVPLYVLSIWTDDADDQADALTQALRGRVSQTPGFSLLQTSQSFETLAIALKCPPKPDSACLQRIGDQLKADHYLWGLMDRKRASAGEVNVEVHLWTRGKPDVSTRESFADSLKDPNEEPLRAIAAGILGKLTGVTPPPPPAPASSTPVASAPAPAPNMADSGLQATAVAAAPGAAAEPAEESDRFPTRTVLAYSALAVGAALIVVSGVEAANWISDNNKSSDDRKQVPKSVTDVCAEPVNIYAQDACNRSKDAVTSSTLAWVFGAMGAGLVATGVVLMVTDHASAPQEDGSANHVRLMPALGAHGGGVDLRVRF